MDITIKSTPYGLSLGHPAAEPGESRWDLHIYRVTGAPTAADALRYFGRAILHPDCKRWTYTFDELRAAAKSGMPIKA